MWLVQSAVCLLWDFRPSIDTYGHLKHIYCIFHVENKCKYSSWIYRYFMTVCINTKVYFIVAYWRKILLGRRWVKEQVFLAAASVPNFRGVQKVLADVSTRSEQITRDKHIFDWLQALVVRVAASDFWDGLEALAVNHFSTLEQALVIWATSAPSSEVLHEQVFRPQRRATPGLHFNRLCCVSAYRNVAWPIDCLFIMEVAIVFFLFHLSPSNL